LTALETRSRLALQPEALPARQASSADAQSAYNKAIEVLKSGDFAAAAQQFTDFMSAYPNSDLVDNAQYWSGEATTRRTTMIRRRSPSLRSAAAGPTRARPRRAAQAGLHPVRAEENHRGACHPGPGADTLSWERGGKLAADRLQKMPAEAH